MQRPAASTIIMEESVLRCLTMLAVQRRWCGICSRILEMQSAQYSQQRLFSALLCAEKLVEVHNRVTQCSFGSSFQKSCVPCITAPSWQVDVVFRTARYRSTRTYLARTRRTRTAKTLLKIIKEMLVISQSLPFILSMRLLSNAPSTDGQAVPDLAHAVVQTLAGCATQLRAV